jgi:hypothetical protein
MKRNFSNHSSEKKFSTISDIERIKGRFFVIGCVRSGTTLLQSIIASHPQLQSFPESHFFRYIYSDGWRRRAGLANKKGILRLKQFIEDCKYSHLHHLIPKYNLFADTYAKSFIKILDTITHNNENEYWIEKTPSHLYNINDIEKYVNNAKFIHIIRNGEDVIASLFEATRDNPDVWNGARSIEVCVKRWKKDIEISKNFENKKNHFIVNYNELVNNTEYLIKEICAFLEIEFDHKMICEKNNSANDIILDFESWKKNTTNKIAKSKIRKFNIIFTKSERQFIRSKLKSNITNPAKSSNGLFGKSDTYQK